MGPTMTIKQTIVDELLDCGDDSAALKGVFDKYSRSKGPLYAALSVATTRVRNRLEVTQKQNVKMEFQRDSLADQVQALEENKERLEEGVGDLEGKVSEEEIRLGEVYKLLERGKELEQAGFGEEELERLRTADRLPNTFCWEQSRRHRPMAESGLSHR